MGLFRNVCLRFISAMSLLTNLVSHPELQRNLRQTKSSDTHGAVLCSKQFVHTRVILGSPRFSGGMLLRWNISISEKSDNLRHSIHPALFQLSQLVHSRSSGPQFSSQATMPQIPHVRIRPMPLSSSMHLPQMRIYNLMLD